MISQETIKGLTATSNEEFDEALASLKRGRLGEEYTTESAFLAHVVKILCTSFITRRERDRRIKLLVQATGLKTESILELTRMVDIHALGIANTLAAILPPAHRQALFKSKKPSLELSPSKPSPVLPLPEVAASSTEITSEPISSFYKAVVLIGTETEHAHNSSLLREHSFAPLRRDNAQDLDRLLASEVCGLVVGGSFWEGKPSDQQKAELESICAATSVLFIRIDETHLEQPAASLLAELRTRSTGMRGGIDFSTSQGCVVTPSDLVTLDRIVRLLSASEGVTLVSDEVTEPEAKLIRIAALKFVNQSSRMALRFVGGGRSGAKVVIVKPDDGGAPLIAKIGPLQLLQEEIAKHQEHIRRWETRINPHLFFHLGSSLLIYELIDDPGAPGIPAPTLEERVERLALSELGSWGDPPPLEENLTLAVERSISKLVSLNTRQHTEHKATSEWLIWGIRELADRGINWQLTNSSEGNLLFYAEQWLSKISKLDGSAICHGDIHLRNILLNEDRVPIFIDYSMSGPGHPCYDLVRLNGALLYKFFRMVACEDEIAALFHAVVIQGATFESALNDYPNLINCAPSRLCIRATVLAREACLRLLFKYGGDVEDYRAMHGLIACQALTIPTLQTGLARAMLKALIAT